MDNKTVIPPSPIIEMMKQTKIMSQILSEQHKTNELLAALVDALAEDSGDPDAPPAYYIDGTPVRG